MDDDNIVRYALEAAWNTWTADAKRENEAAGKANSPIATSIHRENARGFSAMAEHARRLALSME